MKKSALVALAVCTGLAVLWWALRPLKMSGPRIPALFANSLPADCRQVVLVLTPDKTAVHGRLWLMERSSAADNWRPAMDPLTITLGHNGLGWGVGEHTAPAPSGFPIKKEGDKRSPAGVFRLPRAFGMAPMPEAAWLKLPYIPLTSSIIGVDDPKSRYYNQIVDSSQVTRDWDSNEAMMRHGRLYRWGAFIAHNPEGVPGLGSCIFMHIWPGPGRGTSGCTAMSGDDLKTVLAWLDPTKQPRLVQGLEEW